MMHFQNLEKKNETQMLHWGSEQGIYGEIHFFR